MGVTELPDDQMVCSSSKSSGYSRGKEVIMTLFGTRKYVDMPFAAITDLCAKSGGKSRLSRNQEGALSLSHVLSSGSMGPGRHIECTEITEAELPRGYEVWYSPAEIGVAEAGWDAPKEWKSRRNGAAASTTSSEVPTGLED